MRPRAWKLNASVAGLAMGALALGCSGDSSEAFADAGSSTCVPGQQVECGCAVGPSGYQVCRDDGGGYEPCVCPTGSGGSSGGDGGLGGAGGSPGTGGIGGGTGGSGGTCTPTRVEPDSPEVDLYLMLDRSGSMDFGNWDYLVQGLSDFYQDPPSAGLTIAISVFSADGSGPGDPSCSGATYNKPLADWGQLPQSASTFETALSAIFPEGTTPTQDALNGVLEGAKRRQLAQPSHVVAAVLLSDGEACCGDCPIEDPTGLGNIAAEYAQGTPPVGIYTVVMDPSANNVMGAIADAGGTGVPAQDASGSAAAVTQALAAIRDSVYACRFKVPPGADVAKLAIEYTPPGGSPQPIERVASESECGVNGGWYLNDVTSPPAVMLCSDTCGVARSQQGTIELVLGC